MFSQWAYFSRMAVCWYSFTIVQSVNVPWLTIPHSVFGGWPDPLSGINQGWEKICIKWCWWQAEVIDHWSCILSFEAFVCNKSKTVNLVWSISFLDSCFRFCALVTTQRRFCWALDNAVRWDILAYLMCWRDLSCARQIICSGILLSMEI